MWGNILTEVSYIQNFNMGFSNNRADVLIHLTQYQYWWWFWFSFLWVLYYFLVARVFRYRTLKFSPRISSTFRPHGKWGDLLTCIIPVTWCLNILINSNFILKLIEWQSESSLFTLRIRAKQWYWVYKLDLRNISDIFSAPRNIGRNKWQFATFGDLQTAEDYLHIMQMRAYSNWSKDFWSEFGKKSTKKNRFSLLTSVDSYKDNNFNNIQLNAKMYSKFMGGVVILNDFKNTSVQDWITNNKQYVGANNLNKLDYLFSSDIFISTKVVGLNKHTNLLSTVVDGKLNNNTNKAVDFFLKSCVVDNLNTSNNIKHPELDDETRILKKNAGKNTPLRVLKKPKHDFFFKNHTDVIDDIDLFLFRFNDKKPTITNKPTKPTVYLTFKQKRYNQRTNIGKKVKTFSAITNKEQPIFSKYSGNPFLKNMSIIEENFGNPTRQYRMLKKAKNRLDLTRISNYNRLLRSRRVLVLPAHVNITVITNSFDLVHSWFIPGLGLKMDCLPGRATHHTLYIDNVGLYYGQCAEICGRYHHHMPIRICALPFEHFLVWWHTFGLPKFLFPSNKTSGDLISGKYLNRKFSW